MQQHECAMSWKAHCGEVCSVEFSYDENAVYSIGEDGKVGAVGRETVWGGGGGGLGRARPCLQLGSESLESTASWAGFILARPFISSVTLGLSLPQCCHR